jgi:WD40 repeat protein
MLSRTLPAACLLALLVTPGWGEAPPAERENNPPLRVDRYGDPLPEGAVARLGTVRFRHHDVIVCLALSPDGRTVASAGAAWESNPDQPVRLWDLATGRELRQLTGHCGLPNCVAFSPDGKLLACVAGISTRGPRDDTVRVWDVATGKPVHVLRGHKAPPRGGENLYAIAFSPDGKVLASTGCDWTARLWDVATGKELRHSPIPLPSTLLAYSPDGKVLAASGSVGIRLFEAATGKEVRTWDPGDIRSLQFTPDGRALVGAMGDETVRWWDRDSGKELRRISGSLLAASADGRYLAVRDASNVQLWDAARRKELRRFPIPPGGYFASTCRDGHSPYALSADGRILVRADWSTIHVFDTETGKPLHQVPGHRARVVFVAFSADGWQIISAGDTTPRIWDVRTGAQLRQFLGHERAVASAALTADGRTLASGSGDGTIRVWDLASGKERRRLPVESNTSPLVALSPDGKLLVARARYGHDQGLHTWELATGKELRRFWQGNWSHAVSFLPDGRALAELTSAITLFDPASGKRLLEFHGMNNGSSGPTRLAFSADGRLVVTGYPDPTPPRTFDMRTVSLWEVASGGMIDQFRGHDGPASAFAFSPDGRKVASGGCDGTVRIWDLASGLELTRFLGQRGTICALAFSADGELVASGASDTTVLIWRVGPIRRGVERSRLAPGDLSKLWSDLREQDAGVAYRAVWKLAADPERSAPFLTQHLRPVLKPGQRELAQLIALLDDDRFEARERASVELARLGQAVEPALRQILEGRPTPEVRLRVTALLQGLDRVELPPYELRDVRAIGVLEQAGTPEARRILTNLAGGTPKARLTREAKAAIERLAQRSVAPAP